MLHTLKIQSRYFKDVVSGLKTFEIRKNDRDYEVGDTLELEEIDSNFEYTGEDCYVEVTYITDYAQQEGYVVMGIVPVQEEAE